MSTIRKTNFFTFTPVLFWSVLCTLHQVVFFSSEMKLLLDYNFEYFLHRGVIEEVLQWLIGYYHKSKHIALLGNNLMFSLIFLPITSYTFSCYFFSKISGDQFKL